MKTATQFLTFVFLWVIGTFACLLNREPEWALGIGIIGGLFAVAWLVTELERGNHD